MSLRILRFLTFIIIFCISRSFGNPLPLPQAFISELIVEKDGTWKLEIMFSANSAFHQQDFDSICLSTTQGISRIRLDNFSEGALYIVITQDSLDIPLSLNYSGDCIGLHSYVSMLSRIGIDSLPYGNYPGSVISSLHDGCSISRVNYFVFSKDTSPSMGFKNDTTGMMGYLQGYLYDKYNTQVSNGEFGIDNSFIFGNDGKFTTTIYSRKFVCCFIRSGPLNGVYKNEFIDTLFMDMEPDSVVVKDIHLKNFVVRVKTEREESVSPAGVFNYPNPFNAETNFIVTLPTKRQWNQGTIRIYDVRGNMIRSIDMAGTLTASWNGRDEQGVTVSTGVYFYHLIIENTVLFHGSMIYLK